MDTQSPSFDTCGWFGADAQTVVQVGEVLLQAKAATAMPAELLVATDCFDIAVPEVRSALAPVVERISGSFGKRREVALGEGDLLAWSDNQRKLQAGEFGKTFRPWVERCVPRFSIEVGRSLTLASLLTEADLVGPKAFRERARARLDDLLDQDKVLCLPTTPILPPYRNDGFADLVTAVSRIVELTCIAGLTGLPQINLPLGSYQGIPVGLSLIGWRGSDEVLLGLAQALK